MSGKKEYIPPFIYSVEINSSQLLQLSKYDVDKIKQDLTNSQVLDEGICNGNLSKESEGGEGTLW